MGSISIPQWAEKLAEVVDKRLDDGSVETSLTRKKLPDAAATVTAGALTAVFGLTATAEIELFNDDRDVDSDGIVGLDPTPGQVPPTVEWHPLLHPVKGTAWLKYSLTANATAKATSSIGCAAGGINGDRHLRVLCYRRHDAKDRLGKAISQDLGSLLSPLLPAEILALKDGEATALKIRGKLAAVLTLTWSDIFSTSLRQLTSLAELAGSGPILLNVGSKATATFNIEVDDDFTLCFVRQAAGNKHPTRVALRKSVKHDARFEASAGVAVAFADPNAVAAVVTTFLDGLLGAPDGLVKAINKVPNMEAVPAKYQSAIEALLERLGITAGNPFSELKQRLDALQRKTADGIEELAKKKVELGFRYEYMRLKTEASLLELTLSDQALQQLHSALLSFDFAKILAYQGSGLALDLYLHQKTVDRVRAWGFSLGIGTWFNLKSKQERRSFSALREYISPGQTLETRSYTGTTIYSASIRYWNTEYGALFKADKERAGDPKNVTAEGLKCGVELWWEESKLKLPESAERIADDAVLWGAIGPNDYPSMVDRLKGLTSGACKARLNMQLSDYGTQRALNLLAAMTTHDWARNSARALPQNCSIGERSICSRREQVYTPAFDSFAKSRSATGSAFRVLISNALRKIDSTVAQKEYYGRVDTISDLFKHYGGHGMGFWNDWDQLREAASRLTKLMAGRGEWADLSDDFNLMAPVFEQTFTIRIVASLLAEQLPVAVQAGRAFTSTLTVEQGSDVYVISR